MMLPKTIGCCWYSSVFATDGDQWQTPIWHENQWPVGCRRKKTDEYQRQPMILGNIISAIGWRGGGPQKADESPKSRRKEQHSGPWTTSADFCTWQVGEVVKKSEIFADVICVWPLNASFILKTADVVFPPVFSRDRVFSSTHQQRSSVFSLWLHMEYSVAAFAPSCKWLGWRVEAQN